MILNKEEAKRQRAFDLENVDVEESTGVKPITIAPRRNYTFLLTCRVKPGLVNERHAARFS